MADDAAPTAVNDTAALTVAAGAQVAGNVLTNDSDPEHDPLSVSAVNGQAAGVGATIAGTYGSLVLGANGQYTYVLASNPAVQALAPGQTAADVFHYTLWDGFPHTTTTTTITNQNLVTQSEAFDSAAWVKFAGSGGVPAVVANVAAGPTGGAATADQLTLAGANRGLYFNTAVSGQYTFSVWVKLVSGDGHVGLNYYDGGSTGLLTNFVATSSWQRVSITFNASGDADGNVALMHDPMTSSTGVFDFWGAQLNAGSSPSAYLATTGTVASTTTTTTTPITVGADLTVTVTGAGAPNVDAAPTAVNDTAALTVAAGAQVAGNVLTNDSDPEHDPLSVSAVNGQAAGVGATIAGTYGSLVLGANGQYTYVLASNPAVQALAPGQTAADVFHYTLSDGFPHTTTTTTITNQNLVTQSEAFDSAAWVKFAGSGAVPAVVANVAAGPTGGAATADQLTLAGANRGLYFNTAVSGQYTFSVWVKLVSGDGHVGLNYYDGGSTGLLTNFVATSSWQRVSITFNASGDADGNVALMHDPTTSSTGVFDFWGAQLNAGSSPSAYLATTGTVASTTTTTTTPVTVGADLIVAVTGGSTPGVDAAPGAVGDTAALTVAAGAKAIGNVLTNDSDPEHDPLSVSAVNGQAAGVGATIAGTYGTLMLGANGQYTYTLASNAAVQALAPGQTATDSFTYRLSDGLSHTQTQSVITGENFLVKSEAFNDPTWTRFNASGAAPAVTANVAAGPLGGAATADQVTLSGASSGVYYQQAISGQYTFSVWVKLVSGDGHFGLNYYDGGSTGQLTSFVATSSWQRVSITFNGNGASTDNVAFMHSPTQGATGTFQLFGAQLNPGTTPSDYVATNGHFDKVYTQVTSTAAVTGTLNVAVSGPDPAAGAANTLNFAGGAQGVVVNLAANQWSHALKVLPLGDSITDGKTTPDLPANTENGYRGPLLWDTVASSTMVNFVGPNTSGDASLPDQSHAGYPGYRSDQVASVLPSLLSSTHPDAILLMAGVNDIFEETAPAAQVAQSLTNMIATVSSTSPQTHLYVATLTPVSPTLDPADAAMVAGVNAVIKSTVAAAVASGENVSLVDMSSITVGDLAGYAHMTASGYAHMAQIWNNALQAQLATGGQAVSASVTKVIGSEDNDQLIANNLGDSLQGGGGNDILVGGHGRDTLSGGSGSDAFEFAPGGGHDTVTDFSQAQADHLILSGLSGLTSFSQLSGHISVSGGSTIIDLSSFSAGAQIQLTNFTGTLTANDVWIT